jgi:hypothetical protein
LFDEATLFLNVDGVFLSFDAKLVARLMSSRIGRIVFGRERVCVGVGTKFKGRVMLNRLVMISHSLFRAELSSFAVMLSGSASF